MSRILRRPMFKMGGSTNSGIMHGLVDRKRYSNAGIVERAGELIPGFEEYLQNTHLKHNYLWEC